MKQRLLSLADVLTQPRAMMAATRQSGEGLGALLLWLGLEAVLVHPLSIATQLMRLPQNLAAGLVGLWSLYLSYALTPLITVGAIAAAIWLGLRLLRRPHPELWTVVAMVGLAYAPHVWLTAAGAAAAGLGLDLPFLPHELRRVSEGLTIVRLAVGFAPSLLLLSFAMLPVATDPNPKYRRPVRWAALLVMAAGVAGAGSQLAKNFEAARPLLHGDRLAPFSLQRLEGGRVESSEVLGRVSLIDFWATWCVPCVATMPILERLHRELGPQGLHLVSINVEAPGAAVVKKFVRDHGLSFPVYQDDGSVQRAMKVQSYPTAVLVDKDGTVRQIYIGVTSYESLRAAVLGLLQP